MTAVSGEGRGAGGIFVEHLLFPGHSRSFHGPSNLIAEAARGPGRGSAHSHLGGASIGAGDPCRRVSRPSLPVLG